MARIDPVTANQVRAILTLCRARGLDAVMVLDRAGFLSHEGARRQDAIFLVESIIEELTTGPLGLALNAITYPTPMDMKIQIIRALQKVVQQWRSEATSNRPPMPPAI